MFKLYSRGCEYALRALMHIQRENGTERFQAKEVCDRAGVPEAFTRKVFQSLVQAGVFDAARGPGGGYVLTKRSEEITLLEFIKAVDGEDSFDHCIMGLPECGGEHPCPLHPAWAATKDIMLRRLAETTLKDLIELERLQASQLSPEQPATGIV
mgnify:CR=1 FL=1